MLEVESHPTLGVSYLLKLLLLLIANELGSSSDSKSQSAKGSQLRNSVETGCSLSDVVQSAMCNSTRL